MATTGDCNLAIDNRRWPGRDVCMGAFDSVNPRVGADHVMVARLVLPRSRRERLAASEVDTRSRSIEHVLYGRLGTFTQRVRGQTIPSRRLAYRASWWPCGERSFHRIEG
jgi:hypothetical protein